MGVFVRHGKTAKKQRLEESSSSKAVTDDAVWASVDERSKVRAATAARATSAQGNERKIMTP
jgi:hypothetical protein